MKIIKGIFYFIGFIFQLILILIMLLLICLVGMSVPKKIEYAKYKETGIMRNGNLCISHMSEGEGYSKYDEHYNSDNNVLQEVEDFYAIDGLRLGSSDSCGDVFGKVYKPINSGTSDIYVGYAPRSSASSKYELYHVEVDEDLNITYSVEIIDKERFEQNFPEKN